MAKKRPVSEKELPIYRARAKQIAREKGFKITGEFLVAFDKAVQELLEKAIKRAESEGRKTLLPRHV